MRFHLEPTLPAIAGIHQPRSSCAQRRVDEPTRAAAAEFFKSEKLKFLGWPAAAETRSATGAREQTGASHSPPRRTARGGTQHIEMPATPERIWRAMQR